MFLPAYKCGAQEGQHMVSDPLGLSLEMAVSCCVGAANRTKVPGRVANVLNCRDISPALPILLVLMYLLCAYRMISNNRKKGKKI